MSYSLRTKLKHLAHKCELTDKEYEKLIKALDTVVAVEKAIEQIKATCFVNLQDGSEEWRSYVNETVLDVLDIIDKCLKEEQEK